VYRVAGHEDDISGVEFLVLLYQRKERSLVGERHGISSRTYLQNSSRGGGAKDRKKLEYAR